jgi:RHS repeat-associated protein
VGPLEFGYQGLPRDPETGLIYFRNRYYDPELGRFITADPKGYVDGPSMYAFEMDDPANGSDPMGTCKDGEKWTDCIKRAAKETAQTVGEFAGGVAQGIAGSVTLDLLPGAKPKDTDSKAQRVGQIAGASLVAAVGTQATISGGTATFAACASVPVTGPVGAAGCVVGGAETLVAAATVVGSGIYLADAAKKGTSSGKAEPEEGSQKPDKDLTPAERRAKNIAKGIPESELGPSGKPKRHFVQHASEKRAKDAARATEGKGGTTVKHASPSEGEPHYHGQSQKDAQSGKGNHNRVHHEYPD